MSSPRFLCGVLMIGILVALPVGRASAIDVEGEVEKVESELSKVAHADKDQTEPDPLSVDPDLALYTIAVFVVLLIVLKKFAWGPILHALEGR